MLDQSILFIDAVNELQTAMDKAERIIKGLMDSPNMAQIVAEVSDTNNRVTILEPAVLNLRMRQITNICEHMVLIGYVQARDPKRELVTAEGVSWHELAQGPHIVRAVKAIRECFGPIRVDIKDAKTIVDLVKLGLL